METIILKQNGNESVKANLNFRVITTKGRLDMFIHEKYSDVKSRIDKLSKIFKHTNFLIIVIED